MRQVTRRMQDVEKHGDLAGTAKGGPAMPPTLAEMIARALKACPAEEFACLMVEGFRCRFTPPTPHYDGELRRLVVGDFEVLSYVREAWNQIAVLESFQFKRWPPQIPCPLGKRFAPKFRWRLKNTVHALNEEQFVPLIHFHGHVIDGTIGWEYKIPLK